MAKYNCNSCEYTTDKMSNWERHKQSKKHKNNESKLFIMNPACIRYASGKDGDKVAKSNDKSNEITYECDYCGSEFKHHQNMYRHMKYRCKEKISLQNKNEILEKQNKELNTENKKLIDTNLNNSEVTKKSVNVMTYALKHFQDASPVGLLEDDKFDEMTKFLIYDEDGNKKTNKSVEEIIIFHYKKDTLIKVLGELIVNKYKKTNPKKQSIWSSDISRLTFIVRDIIGKTKKSKWITDKKGIHITQTVINPMMDIIKKRLIKFVNKSGKIINETKDILSKMHDANLALLAIKLGKIHSEILRYIAPHFNFNIDDKLKTTNKNRQHSSSSLDDSDIEN